MQVRDQPELHETLSQKDKKKKNYLFLFYFLVFALFIHSFLWLAQPALGARLAQHVLPGIKLWSLPPKYS